VQVSRKEVTIQSRWENPFKASVMVPRAVLIMVVSSADKSKLRHNLGDVEKLKEPCDEGALALE
jgi:hypothetical protein